MISRKFSTTLCLIRGEKMIEQGYNYLDGPIYSMVEFFKTRIENLENSIPPSVPSRNRKKNKKDSNKYKAVTFDNADDEDLYEGHKGKKFCKFHGICGHTTEIALRSML